MAEQQDDQGSTGRQQWRETGVVRVMTSTSVHRHPTAFSTTRLPVLETLLNAQAMTARFRELLADKDPAVVPVVNYAKLLAYKQGNRGLIRYDVRGLPWGESCAVFGKLYPDAAVAARVADTMRLLHDQVFADDDQLGVPRVLGCLQDVSMLVYLPADGQTLDEVVTRPDAPRYLELAGRWLGRLHQQSLPFERQLHLDNELLNIGAWAVLINARYPETTAATERITAYLQAGARQLAFETETPIHKDFHYGHIVVDGGLKVIDFDEMRRGDPNFDLAHFCACLHLLAYRTHTMPFGFSTLQRSFLDGYARVTGWQSNERFLYFYAYTCLKIAKQLCTMRGLRPRPEGEEQRRQVLVTLEQALGAMPPEAGRKLSRRFATLIVPPDADVPPSDRA